MFGIGEFFAAKDAKKKQQQVINQQYNASTYGWAFDNEARTDAYNFAVKDNIFARANQENALRFQEQTNLLNWADQLKIAARQDQINISAYNKSVQTYGLQLDFNNIAATAAYAAEQRKLQDTVTEMSFQNQDMTIKALEEAGNLQARGVSGRSAGKALNAVLAQVGRNQGILAESLVSAESNFRQSNNKIATDKFGGDLKAWGEVMDKPIMSARPSAPLAMPRALIQDPLKPKTPPKPVKGVNTAPSPGIALASGIANTVANIGMALI
jgi:hypothetical protein